MLASIRIETDIDMVYVFFFRPATRQLWCMPLPDKNPKNYGTIRGVNNIQMFHNQERTLFNQEFAIKKGLHYMGVNNDKRDYYLCLTTI